jgi:hypothetical protein
MLLYVDILFSSKISPTCIMYINKQEDPVSDCKVSPGHASGVQDTSILEVPGSNLRHDTGSPNSIHVGFFTSSRTLPNSIPTSFQRVSTAVQPISCHRMSHSMSHQWPSNTNHQKCSIGTNISCLDHRQVTLPMKF